VILYLYMLYSQSISAREMQREYRQVFAKANKGKKPVVVFAHNRPLGAVIGMDMLEKLQVDYIVNQALRESKEGKTVVIDTPQKLQSLFKTMRDEAKIK
jgi:prevent-host-death family protein